MSVIFDNTFTVRGSIWTSESDVYGRQILTTKVDPALRFIMAVDYSKDHNCYTIFFFNPHMCIFIRCQQSPGIFL